MIYKQENFGSQIDQRDSACKQKGKKCTDLKAYAKPKHLFKGQQMLGQNAHPHNKLHPYHDTITDILYPYRIK